MKQNVRRAILAGFGVAAMAPLTDNAHSAPNPNGPFVLYDFGVLSGTHRFTWEETAPYKSYSEYGAKNMGWLYTGKLEVFTLGTPEEIAAGARYDVVITMKGRGPRRLELDYPGALDNPSFTVWALHDSHAPYDEDNPKVSLGGQHAWSQLRGPNDDVNDPLSTRPGKLPDGNTVIANNIDDNDSEGVGDGNGTTPNGIPDGGLLAMGVVDGHEGWVGYAQSGPSVIVRYDQDPLNFNPQTKNGTPVEDFMPYGWFVNHQSPFVNGRKSRGKVTSGKLLDLAQLKLKGLKAGAYLIGSGGSCGNGETCNKGAAFRLTISTTPRQPSPGAAVPN